MSINNTKDFEEDNRQQFETSSFDLNELKRLAEEDDSIIEVRECTIGKGAIAIKMKCNAN